MSKEKGGISFSLHSRWIDFAAHNTRSSTFVSQTEGEEVGSYGEARQSDGDGGVKFFLNIAVFTLHLLLEAIQELLAMQTRISESLSSLSNWLQVFISPVEL